MNLSIPERHYRLITQQRRLRVVVVGLHHRHLKNVITGLGRAERSVVAHRVRRRVHHHQVLQPLIGLARVGVNAEVQSKLSPKF